MCFLDSGKTPLPPYSKSVETLGQKYFCKMIQEVQRPRSTLRWIKNHLRMEQSCGVLGVCEELKCYHSSLALFSCVCMCVSTHTYTHTHTQIFFLGFNWHLLWIQERGRIFENNYFSLQNSYSGLREPDCSLSQQVLEKMVANMRRPMKWQKHDSECFYSLSYGMRLGDTQQCLPAFRNSGWEGWFGGQQVGVPSIACLV